MLAHDDTGPVGPLCGIRTHVIALERRGFSAAKLTAVLSSEPVNFKERSVV
jgi:hypothetical protein